MTSTINAVSGTGVVNTPDGSGILKVQSNGVTTNALAWVNFTVSGGVCTRQASYNVSSVTYNSTGNYTVNFANALSDANYAPALGGMFSTGAGTSYPSFFGVKGTTTSAPDLKTTSALTVFSANYAGGAVDAPNCSVVIFGN